MTTFDYRDLVIFEMANNHQGDVDHGVRIIKEMAGLAAEHGIRGAVKLQYRQLDTFIHPEFRTNTEAKHIGRFLSTELSAAQFEQLVTATRENDLVTVVTPFDEASVDLILEHGVEVIKVASCSADDWPLLERIARAGLPVIASTGGLSAQGIDELVSFFEHRNVPLAILHCVAIYPTDRADQHLAQIKRLKRRYPELTIGYSGHEAPDDVMVGPMAIAAGAEILERHVGVPTENIQLNGYSMSPPQVSAWLGSIAAARTTMGSSTRVVTADEHDSLLTLQRGVFAKRPIAAGATIGRDDVYFAMPPEQGQLTSGDFGTLRASFVASRDYGVNEAIFETCEEDLYLKVRRIVHEAKGMLAEAGVVLNEDAEVELSHHYGLEEFAETGCLIVNLINREYCKKIIVVFPGQKHPEQHHLRKEETFHVLAGEVELDRNGLSEALSTGDIAVIERGVLHAFKSSTGAVIEEVSTTHFRDDSFYTDQRIAELDPMQRKTILERF